MSSLHLSSYNTVYWRPGKPGSIDVVSPVSSTGVTPLLSPASLTLEGVAAPAPLLCVKQPKQELILWLPSKGCRDFRKSPKAFHNVLHVCTEDTHIGVFYSQHHGEDLSFALVQNMTGAPDRLVGSPRDYTVEVAALLDDVVPLAARQKAHRKNSKHGASFAVQHAVLRRTVRGYIVAAALSAVCGDGGLYGIVGDLEANVWRKWKMDADTAVPPCFFIPASGDDVRAVRCDVERPADADATSSVSPSTTLALSSFERVSTMNETDGSSSTHPLSSSSRVVCAVFRECVVPTRAGLPVTERRYQSQLFRRSQQNDSSSRCFTAVEEKSRPVYTIIVPDEPVSYVLHASHAVNTADLSVTATAIPDLRYPLSVCRLRIPTHPHRPNGTSLSVVLCRDMQLYACEHFGQSAAVVLRINNLRTAVVTSAFPPLSKHSAMRPSSTNGGDAAGTAFTRLLAVQDNTELLCSNGVAGVFLRVSAALLDAAVPALPRSAAAMEAPATAGSSAGLNGGAGGSAALRQCLTRLEELSLRTTRHDLPDVVFREVIPLLRGVGTSQQEVMLVQRVYEQLLQMAGPNLQSEWNYLWALTSMLQQTLAQRDRDNAVIYTDAFFLQLASVYQRSDFASTDGAKVVEEAVRAGASPEVARVLAAQPANFPPEVHYVLDGLAEGVPLLDLAEEVARRMVHTSTLANGTCVVSTLPGKAECVHGMGCVLLASCLDLHVFACAQEGREMRVSLQQQPDADTNASRPSCVSVLPHTFLSQDEFEKALTLAADLLCVSTADASFRPDMALLTLAIGGRQHCLAAYVQLFAPVLRAAVEEVAPLSNNAAWLEACAAALSRDYREQATALLGEARSSGMTLSTTLSYALYAPQQTINVAVFRMFANTLSEEFCTTALVACIFHQTDRLVAATHNYAAAVATLMLGKMDSTAQGGWQAVQLGRQRLHSTLAHTNKLWALMDSLSPYNVRDVATSYRVSARNSLQPSSAAEQGTVASRTLVACFRLLCLVQHCCDGEAATRDAGDGAWRDFERCAGAVSLLHLMKEAPVPLEWYQRGFVDLVQAVSTQQPAWAPYLLRLLQLSNVRESGSASLKKDFYKLLDTVQNRLAEPAGLVAADSVRDALQRVVVVATSSVTALTVQQEVPDHRQAAGDGVDSASRSSSTYFVFSPSRDTSLPRWTTTHSLPERRYLFPQEWTKVLWTLERAPEALQQTCERTLKCIAQLSSTGTVEESPASLSMEMANPLFGHLCRLRPPVRVHAVAPHVAETCAAAAAPDAVRRQPMAASAVAAAAIPVSEGATATPEKLHAPREETRPLSLPSPSPLAAAAAAKVTGYAAANSQASVPMNAPILAQSPAAAFLSPLEKEESARAGRIHIEHTSSPAQHPSTSSLPPQPSASAPSLSNAVAHNAAVVGGVGSLKADEDAVRQPALYAPADVAWWDTIGLPTSASRTMLPAATSGTPSPAAEAAKDVAATTNTATGDDNGESSDTATSYTTSTSNYADPMAAIDEFGRGTDRAQRQSGYHRSDNPRRSSSSTADSSSVAAPPLFRTKERRRRCCTSRSPRSRAENTTKKKCRCCSGALRSHCHCHRHRTGLAAPKDPLEASFALRWQDGAVERTVSPLRPPSARAADTARPTLLSFASRLQPPEEPTRTFAHTARCASPRGAVGDRNSSQVALLRLPSSPTATRESARVRLYTLRGERVDAADGSDAVSLHNTGAARCSGLLGRAAPLNVPAMPPSSVFVAPPPLLRLPQQTAHEKDALVAVSPPPPSPPTHNGVAPEDNTSAALLSYPQAARAPVGPAPPAVDLTTLQNPSTAEASAVGAAPVPAVAPTGTALPVPVPPAATPASVLNANQVADFHRYTDELLARHATPPAVSQAMATAPTSNSALPAAELAVETEGAAADCPGVARLVQQQEDFIRKAEAILHTRQAENEGFYRRVVESIRSLTAASKQLHGMTPVEQSQLVRDTVKQRNELMSLNHQLLDMQLAAARVTGEMPPDTTAAPAASSGSRFSIPAVSPTAVPRTTAQTTQTPPPPAVAPRASVGVSWASPQVASALTSVPTQTPAAPKVGMQETLSDLQRLNTELMGVNASAAAMDKAIKETRDVIQRYERSKTAEALTAEGVALTSAMRLRTAAIEQRLAELPRTAAQSTHAAAVSTPAASRVWTGQSFSSVDTGLAEETAAMPSAAKESSANGPPQRRAPAEAAAPAGEASANAHPQPLPLPCASPSSLLPPPSGRTPSRVAAEAPTTEATASVCMKTSPTFTSVSSTPLTETTAAATATPPQPVPRAVAVKVHQSPSVSFATVPLHSELAPSHAPQRDAFQHARNHDERVGSPLQTPVPARVYTKPCDLRALFMQAGGVVHAGAHTPPKVSRSAAAAAAARPPPSLVPRRDASRSSAAKSPSMHAPSAGDRYAMYRVPAKQPRRLTVASSGPSSCLPLAYAQGSEDAHAAPFTSAAIASSAPGASQPNAAGGRGLDRQRDRRMSSIARRMQQLEHDLFD